MHSNVTDINTARRKRYISNNVEEVREEVKNILTGAELADGDVAIQSVMLKDLDALADDMLVRKLALIHAKEAAIRNWTAEEAAIAAELEAAAYLAFRAGVPEEAIYELNSEPLSEALSSAIRKVQSA